MRVQTTDLSGTPALGLCRRALVCLLAVSVLGFAGEKNTGAKGHWTGNIQIDKSTLGFGIDLTNQDGKWVGTMSIPLQNLHDLFFTSVSVVDSEIVLVQADVLGTPTIKGTLSADRQSISGVYSQGSKSFPFLLVRSGEPQITKPRTTPLTQAMQGEWEGALPVGRGLHLLLNLSTDQTGRAACSLRSLDEGPGDISAGTVMQRGNDLRIEFPALGATYVAKLKETSGGTLDGWWSQGGASLPLTLTHPHSSPQKGK